MSRFSTYYSFENFAYDGTKMRRKVARRHVRNVLGTSRDEAPRIDQVLSAMRSMDELLRDASGGQFEILIRDRGSMVGTTYNPGQALQRVRATKEERERRLNEGR